MLKIKENAVRTMAEVLAKISDKKELADIPAAESPEAIQMNRKLREAFGLLGTAQKTPFAPPSDLKDTLNKKILPSLPPAAKKIEQGALAEIGKDLRKIPDLESEKEQLEKSEKKLREIEERKKKEQEKKMQEAAKAAEEQKKREEERLAAEEKARQEKLRIQKEKDRAREEKRQRLALLEAEREKKTRQDQERQKQEAIKNAEATRQQAVVAAELAEKDKADDLPAALQTLITKLRAKRESFEKQLASIPALKAPLEQKRLIFESKVAMVKNSELAAVEQSEREIEKKIALERGRLEQNSDPQQEKALKQKIWEIEDRRKEIEQQRWTVEDHINKIKAEAESIGDEIIRKDKEAEFIRQNIKNAAGKEKIVKFALDKDKLEEEILKIIGEKESLLPAFDAVAKTKAEQEATLADFSKKEISANAELNAIEEQERQASDPAKKREIEQARWRISGELKSIVQSKWESEAKLKQVTFQAQTLQEKINTFNAKIDKIQNNIAAGEIILENEGLPVREIRDSIREIFKENGIEIDQDVLQDIIQAKDTQKQNLMGPEPAKDKQAQFEQKTANGTEKNPNKPAGDKIEAKINSQTIQKQDISQPKAAPTPEPEKPQITGDKTSEALAGPKAAQQPAPAQTDSAEKPKQTDSAAPTAQAPSPEQDNRAGEKEKELPAKNEESKAGARTPETKTNETAPAPAPAQEFAEAPADTLNPTSKTISFYREQVDSSLAKNIRTFDGDDFIAANRPKSNGQNKPAERISSAGIPDTARVSDQRPENLRTENSTAGDLESRWNQIKKTTIPAANPAASTENYPPDMPARLPEKRGSNKFLARMLVIFLVAGILGIALVIALSKNNNTIVVKKTAPPITASPTKNPATPEENNDNKSQTLTTISTITIYAEDLASIHNLILPYLRKSFESKGYYKLSIQNLKNNTKVGLKQFFSIYKINAPQMLYTSVSDDFTLFIYANNGANRLGFVAPVTDAVSLEMALDGWEGSAAIDTENLFRSLGRKTQTQTNDLKFSSANAPNGAPYRSMNFTPAGDNFSLAWANYQKKYLIFTTSNESMAKIFDQLPK